MQDLTINNAIDFALPAPFLGRHLIETGLPKGICIIVLGHGDSVARLMSSHKVIDMVSFTGSTAVGKHIPSTSLSA